MTHRPAHAASGPPVASRGNRQSEGRPVLVAADPAHPRVGAPGLALQAGQLRDVPRAMVDDDRREAEASEFAEDPPAPDPIL